MEADFCPTRTTSSPSIKTLKLTNFDTESDGIDDRLQVFLAKNKKTASQAQWGKSPPSNTKSIYKGVTTTGLRKKKYIYWLASIGCGGKTVWRKQFPYTDKGEKRAALAYDKAALELFGEHAYTNQMHFPENFK